MTLLRADQYTDLASFRDVGAFVPLAYDHAGAVIREVAPAQFAVPLPHQAGAPLPLTIALVRDLRWQVPVVLPAADRLQRWDADLPWQECHWYDAAWEATAAPARPTTAKLIPIVATAPFPDATTLARTYFRRWPVQENVIRDWLIPLGIDTNHGYAKTEVVNSEVAKRRGALTERLTLLKRWAIAAGKRSTQASTRYQRLHTAANVRARELSDVLFKQQRALEEQGVTEGVYRQAMREAKAVTQAEMDGLNEQTWRAYDTCNREDAKHERYCRDQRAILRALAELAGREQQMYELDNAKDQVMTVCKVALANLGMWIRDHYFPATYSLATWNWLLPFFRLTGQVIWEADQVRVVLKPFTDRQLTRDLQELCTRVKQQAPHLPDGRKLIFTLSRSRRLTLDDYP